jgi:opacity protein-like surface antigen
MKKYVLIGLLAVLANGVTSEVNYAPKNGWFVGGGMNNQKTKVFVKNQGGKKGYHHSVGMSLLGGYTFNFNHEMYLRSYAVYHALAPDTFKSNGGDSGFKVPAQYGVNLDAGYAIRPELSIYGTLGAALFSYEKSKNGQHDSGSSDLGVVAGLGFRYAIHSNWTANVSYQSSESHVNVLGERKRVTASGIHLTTAYHF